MEIDLDEAATVAATVASAMPRIEIVSEHRRSHDAAFRAQVLADARHPGVRMRDVARRHGICSSLIYRWRREATGLVGAAPPARLVPVRVAPLSPSEPRASDPASVAATPRSDGIEFELPNGVRIRVSGEIGTLALRRVVAALRE